MCEIDIRTLSERDICTKFITPALEKSGWNKMTQILEEVFFTDGRIYVRGKLTARGEKKRADYILYYKPNIPVAIIEAKDNNHTIGAGMQQALNYARILDIPCVFSSNGDGFLFHDKTAEYGKLETELKLGEFPSPETLWKKYKKYKGISTERESRIASQDYYFDVSGRKPRYYQQIAINRTVEAIAGGQNRILLVMATGTGKTYVAYQVIYRLWKAGVKKRILFLADRNCLIDQTRRGDFKHFKNRMTVVKHRQVDKSYEIYLSLYQGLSGSEEDKNIYKQFSPDFFDLIVVDECHRGSARDDSAWRDILTYFKSAAHIGLTATPKETVETSNIEYFGEPIYTYSLKQGINDGFLAPYRVIRVNLNIDVTGWIPPKGFKDKNGNLVESRLYNRIDFDRTLVVDERRKLVAKKISEFLKGYDRYAKTICFFTDIEHAEAMTTLLRNENSDIAKNNYKYVMQITGDNEEGKRELDNFINPEETYPVIANTSELMTTGVDAQTCKVIVLDSEIKSMTKFKQIIGRGTRINEDYDKLFFTILDFRNVTHLFVDKDFDGDPIRIKPVSEDVDLTDVIDEEEKNLEPVIDEENGNQIVLSDPDLRKPEPQPVSPPQTREKVYVNGIDVSVLLIQEMFHDYKGNLITENLKDYTKRIINNSYSSLNDFLTKWQNAERKEAIIEELKSNGVIVEALVDAVSKPLDLFDLICFVAYGQPPLTRKERADNVRKRNYFTKYGDKARKILDALLDKYADEGISDIENVEVLRVKPFVDFGSPVEIIREFGDMNKYLKAVKELENELYKTA